MSGTNPAVEEAFDHPDREPSTSTGNAGGNPNVEEAFDRPDDEPSTSTGNAGGNPAVEKVFDRPNEHSERKGPQTNPAVDKAFDGEPKEDKPQAKETAVDEAFDTPSNKSGTSAAQDEGQKSKFQKIVEPVKNAVGHDKEKETGESGASSKIKNVLSKGGNPAT